MEEVLRIVSTGGDAFLLVIGYILWKFDRRFISFDKRLIKIETLLNNHLEHLTKEKESR